jgi:hypothetical protein
VSFLHWFVLAAAVFMIVSPTRSAQIGPPIRIGGGEATIGGLGVKKGGGIAVPTVDQLIDNVINSTPLTVLSDADKNNIRGAIKTTGYVAAVASDPVTGIIVISVLSGKGEKQDIPIPTVNSPPTGKTWTFNAKCLVQQAGGLITAMFNDDPEHIDDPQPGDILTLTAGYCPEYKDKSITSVKITWTGHSDYPNAQPPLYKHYIVGNTV